MAKRQKNVVAAERWAREVGPIAKFAADNAGFITELSRRFGVRCREPKKHWRVMVGVWLNQASEPVAGTGLLLIEEGRKLIKEWPAFQAANEGADNE